MVMEPGSKSKLAKTLPALPEIPEKQYFSISEAATLCGVKAHVLRYWEQEFPQLRPLKRRGNRRYYQKHDLLLVRQIRSLLYGEGFTIHGARERIGQAVRNDGHSPQLVLDIEVEDDARECSPQHWRQRLQTLRRELELLRNLCVRSD